MRKIKILIIENDGVQRKEIAEREIKDLIGCRYLETFCSGRLRMFTDKQSGKSLNIPASQLIGHEVYGTMIVIGRSRFGSIISCCY